jgi:hypothetical protein
MHKQNHLPQMQKHENMRSFKGQLLKLIRRCYISSTQLLSKYESIMLFCEMNKHPLVMFMHFGIEGTLCNFGF